MTGTAQIEVRAVWLAGVGGPGVSVLVPTELAVITADQADQLAGMLTTIARNAREHAAQLQAQGEAVRLATTPVLGTA